MYCWGEAILPWVSPTAYLSRRWPGLPPWILCPPAICVRQSPIKSILLSLSVFKSISVSLPIYFRPFFSLSFFNFLFLYTFFPFPTPFFNFFSFCHLFCVRHYLVSDTRAFWRICFCQMLYSTSRGKTDKLEEPVNRELNVIRSWNFIQILNLAWFIDWMSCKLICIFYNLKAPLLENR